MNLTNLNFIYFCQNLLGAPYWYNAAAIKATKNAYKVNALRFPDRYKDELIAQYQQHILDNEIVTDTIGLIKGFAWSNGGDTILEARGTDKMPTHVYCGNNCPDKTPNGLLNWAITKNINWGGIESLPEVPGLIISMNDKLAIYEGKGYVILSDENEGILIREPLENQNWKFWYELPFIEYLDDITIQSEIKTDDFTLQLNGLAIATSNVLFREGPNEDAKLLDIIQLEEKVQVYNDSTDKWLHIVYKGQEGYTIPEFFLYFPKAPNIISPDMPHEIDKNLQIEYILLKNIGLKNKGHIRSNNYVILPKETVVLGTGGYTNNWIHVYVEYNNRSYVGYIDQKFLRKVSDLI